MKFLRTPDECFNHLPDYKFKPNYVEILEENASVLEYIDSIETENALIAKDMKTFENVHTHCEIHPSLMLSAVSLNIPFPEHAPAANPISG